MLGKLVAVWHGIVWYLREVRSAARPATTIILSISRPSIPAKHR